MAFSTCSFHHQVSWCQRRGRIVPHTSSIVLSRPVLMLFQISSVISYTCRCTHMWIEDLLEMFASLRVFKLSNFKARGELALGFRWHISPHVAYKRLMLQGYFLARDHFYICDKFAHGLQKKDEVCLCGHVSRLVRDEMAVTFLETCVPKGSLTLNIWFWPAIPQPTMHFPLYPVPAWPTWLFQSPHGIRNSDPRILVVTACSWSKNRSLTSSLRPPCGANTDRKVTTRWPNIRLH